MKQGKKYTTGLCQNQHTMNRRFMKNEDRKNPIKFNITLNEEQKLAKEKILKKYNNSFSR